VVLKPCSYSVRAWASYWVGSPKLEGPTLSKPRASPATGPLLGLGELH
jgi:hypothetical protein